MNDPWYVVLRDLLIILAALATVLAASFGTLVAWRLYQLAQAVRGEIEPILSSLSETAATVRDSAAFVHRSRAPSPVTAVGLLGGGLQLFRLMRQVRRRTTPRSGTLDAAGPENRQSPGEPAGQQTGGSP